MVIRLKLFVLIIKNPSELWDEFVVTGKARSQIRKFIRSKKESEIFRDGQK